MKKNILLVIIFLFLSMIFFCCKPQREIELTPTYNSGGYTMAKLNNKLLNQSESAIIYGYVKEYNSLNKLQIASIKIGCAIIQVDSIGYYQFKGKIGDSPIFLTCSFIGYKSIETQHFKLERGDSVKVDFFLAEDDRPLINCEGQ